MDSQGNLMNGNPMALNKYIFQVMYPNKYYIFGIIDEYYEYYGPPKVAHKGKPHSYWCWAFIVIRFHPSCGVKKQKYHFFLTLSKIPAWRPA